MQLHRKVLLTLAVVLVGGSLCWSATVALRLRSEAYRREVTDNLSRFFELPCDVARIRGRTFSSRTFEDVTVWLPDRRDKVFSCRRAVWSESEREGRPINELDLSDGILNLGSDRWARSDYRQILESSLGHDFEDLHLVRVGMERFEVTLDRREFDIRCGSTSGTIDTSNPRDGIARLTAYEINGYPVSQGVQIHARFVPKNGVKVTEVVLNLPEVPLACVGITAALGGTTPRGRFAGSVQYVDRAATPELTLNGDLMEAQLRELTARLPTGPLDGEVSVTVSGAKVRDGALTHVRGHGVLRDLSLAPLGPLLGAGNVSGTATVALDDFDMADGRIRRIRLSGQIGGLLPTEWLALVGRGAATGQLEIRVNNLDILEGRIRSADVEMTLAPRTGETGTFDRELLLTAAKEILSFQWPESLPQSLLPEKVEYTECGVRLLVRDNQLRVLGTHGRRKDTILTIRLLGQDFGLVKEQAGSIDLGPAVERGLQRLRSSEPDTLRQWIRRSDSKS